MDIEFDPNKDLINQAKHGVSLAAAALMDMSAATIIPDDRYEYGEVRLWAVAPIEDRMYILSYTQRGDVIRAISLRKANARERKRYGKP